MHLHACVIDGVFMRTGDGLSVIRGSKDRIAKVRYVLPRHKAASWVGPGSSGKSTRQGANGVLKLSPFEFLDRLADLVPPPRKHRHRYHGVFAFSQPPPTTSAPMPTQFSIGVDLHRHTCGTGTFSSISPLEISSYRYRGTLQPTCQHPDDP